MNQKARDNDVPTLHFERPDFAAYIPESHVCNDPNCLRKPIPPRNEAQCEPLLTISDEVDVKKMVFVCDDPALEAVVNGILGMLEDSDKVIDGLNQRLKKLENKDVG